MKLFSVASVALLQIGGVLAQTWGPPSGAITWENLGHIRVYAVDPKGNIREWQYDGGGWTGPSYIGSGAVPGSALTAVNDGSRLRVYYRHTSGSIRERVYENGWGDGSAMLQLACTGPLAAGITTC